MKLLPAPESSPLFGDVDASRHRARSAVEGNPDYLVWRLGSHTVYAREEALRSFFAVASEYGRLRKKVEVGFLCMGRREQDAQGPYAIIEALPFVAVGARTTVRMTAEDKAAARARHPALDVVGWAHTHPGYGVFFSGTDLVNCRDYGPDAVNLVIDPLRDELGIAVGAEIRVTSRGLQEALVADASIKVPSALPSSASATVEKRGPCDSEGWAWFAGLWLGVCLGMAWERDEAPATVAPAIVEVHSPAPAEPTVAKTEEIWAALRCE